MPGDSAAAAIAASGRWQGRLEDRLKMCRHIFTKFEAYYRSMGIPVTNDDLRMRTRMFESDAFMRALSRKQYLENIANELTGVVVSTAENNSSAADVSNKALSKNQYLERTAREATGVEVLTTGDNISAAATMAGGCWQDDMSERDRLKVCRHILTKLEVYYRFRGKSFTDDELQERTRGFEFETFRKASSKKQYLEKIAEGLAGLEASTVKDNSRSNIAATVALGRWQDAMGMGDVNSKMKELTINQLLK